MKKGKKMARIQFGWTITSGPRVDLGVGPEAYFAAVNRGFDLINGHFDSAWFVDHLEAGDDSILEGWTALTYFAAQHPQSKFGHAVLSQSFRNPALLAKMAATLQYMSDGRYILGIGAGWKESEYIQYGYPYPPAGVRVEELGEALEIIKLMWHEQRATFHGKHYHIEEAWCEPKPKPIPTIMIGGARPHMLRLVARYADWWNVSWTGIDRYREQVKECERACQEVGRDPATLRRTWFGGCVCGPNEAVVQDLNKNSNISASNAFVGTTQQVIEQMQQFVDLGVDYFMLSSIGFPDLTTLETLVNDVMPALNR